jgi:hypothetical protein
VGCVDEIEIFFPQNKHTKPLHIRQHRFVLTMTLIRFSLYISSLAMGVSTLLPHLPGGDKEMSSFLKLKMLLRDEVIAPFDAESQQTGAEAAFGAWRHHCYEFRAYKQALVA